MDDSTDTSGGDFFSSLDTLIGTVGNYATANAAARAAATQNNATAVNAVASAQVAATKSNMLLYVVGAVLVAGAIYLIASR